MHREKWILSYTNLVTKLIIFHKQDIILLTTTYLDITGKGLWLN